VVSSAVAELCPIIAMAWSAVTNALLQTQSAAHAVSEVAHFAS